MTLLRRIEQGQGHQELGITPQTLLKDNNSPKAIYNREEWRKAKESGDGQMTLFIVCGDARIVTAEMFGGPKIVSISSIASSGDLEPFSYLLQHKMVGQIVVVGHFDHEKINKTGKIAGCGGQDTSQSLQEGKVKIEDGNLHHFIKQRVTPDFFRNVEKIVEEAAKISEKPVLGVLADHLTYGAFPIIEQLGRRQIKLPDEYLKMFKQGQIEDLKDFLTIGSNVFPELKIEDLQKVFRGIINKNRNRAVRRLEKDPRFIERQRNQNPSSIVISTCPMPTALRYPETFGQPNSAFVLRQPFMKTDNGVEYKIDDVDFNSIAGQILYPISHTLMKDPNKAFYSTKNLLIETPDLELSAQIAERLLKIDFIQEWVSKCGGKIMIGEVKEEKTIQVQPYPNN